MLVGVWLLSRGGRAGSRDAIGDRLVPPAGRRGVSALDAEWEFLPISAWPVLTRLKPAGKGGEIDLGRPPELSVVSEPPLEHLDQGAQRMTPAQDAPTSREPSEASVTENGRTGAGGGMAPPPLAVLYAEDNPYDVRLVEILIKGQREQTVHLESAPNLEDALKVLEQGRVDVLLLDLTLPDSRGIDTIERVIRASLEVPIVVLTGFRDQELGVRALRAGALDFLSKEGLTGELLVRTLELTAERGRLERELRESERRYALAAEGSNDGLWDWDLRHQRVHYSERWKHLLGYTENEVAGTPEEWLSRVHPQDRRSLDSAVNELCDGKASSLEHEHRVQTKEGAWRWMLCRAAAARDAQGKCLRIAGSLTDITLRKQTEEELRRGAFYDSLTGLPNRALFLDRLRQCVVRSPRRPETGYAVLFLDLDRFKWINDSIGHHGGDLLLIEVARRLQSCVRPTDTVARLGGDEFTVLMDEMRHEHHAIHLTERVFEALSAPFTIEGQEVIARASIGIALGPAHYDAPGQVLRDADIAMHKAKKAGKGRYAVFEASMHEEAVHLVQLEANLRRGLEQQQFRLHYQPIVSLETGRISSFEALLRWQHPNLGRLSPDSFLEVAEETGVICEIGGWVLREACTTTARWQEEIHRQVPICVNVNLSGREFRSPQLEGNLDDAMAASSLDPGSLHVEITEGTAMEGMAERPLLQRLRARGIHLAIDDFGTGYSSLAALHLIPVECLKIDKTFVQRIGTRGENTEIVEAIIRLADSLGLKTIAEGVETRNQLAALRHLGCQYGQGFLFSPPVPAEEAKVFLQRRESALGSKPFSG